MHGECSFSSRFVLNVCMILYYSRINTHPMLYDVLQFLYERRLRLEGHGVHWSPSMSTMLENKVSRTKFFHLDDILWRGDYQRRLMQWHQVNKKHAEKLRARHISYLVNKQPVKTQLDAFHFHAKICNKLQIHNSNGKIYISQTIFFRTT